MRTKANLDLPRRNVGGDDHPERLHVWLEVLICLRRLLGIVKFAFDTARTASAGRMDMAQ